MLFVSLSMQKPEPEIEYLRTRPIYIEPERIQLKSTQAPTCDRTRKPPPKRNIVQSTAPKEVLIVVVETNAAPLTSTTPSLEATPSCNMTKSSTNDNRRPDEPRPLGWNIEGAPAIIPAPPHHAETSDPLQESFAPSAPAFEDIR